MIFTTKSLDNGDTLFVFDREDEADDCYLMLVAAFPSIVMYFNCFNGYYNALHLPQSPNKIYHEHY